MINIVACVKVCLLSGILCSCLRSCVRMCLIYHVFFDVGSYIYSDLSAQVRQIFASVMNCHFFFSLQTAHIPDMETYRKMYDQSVNDPNAFWGNLAQGLEWIHPYK